jgi:dihydrodipicolinate synthase/N-acetylneuraminate lyase
MPAIEGVYAAAVTPRRRASQEIDLGAMWDLIDFLCSKKVDGIVLFGSTGEFVHFSIDERTRVIGLAVKRSRVPILVNVSHSTFDGAVTLAEAAMHSGASGLLLMPPYFFRYFQADVLAFYRKFATEVRPRVPALIYHIPLFTNDVGVDCVAELISDGSYAGVKDSSGDWANFESLRELQARKPFTLMMGSDGLFARARPLGASGAISGIASAAPELLVGLRRAIDSGDTARVERLQARIAEIISWLDRFPVPIAVKEAVVQRGIKAGGHAIPLSAGDEQKLAEFRDWFRTWISDVIKECA